MGEGTGNVVPPCRPPLLYLCHVVVVQMLYRVHTQVDQLMALWAHSMSPRWSYVRKRKLKRPTIPCCLKLPVMTLLDGQASDPAPVLSCVPQGSVLGLILTLIFGTRDLFNISYSRELYLFSKFLHFEEIVCVKMSVCFEMIVSET